MIHSFMDNDDGTVTFHDENGRPTISGAANNPAVQKKMAEVGRAKTANAFSNVLGTAGSALSGGQAPKTQQFSATGGGLEGLYAQKKGPSGGSIAPQQRPGAPTGSAPGANRFRENMLGHREEPVSNYTSRSFADRQNMAGPTGTMTASQIQAQNERMGLPSTSTAGVPTTPSRMTGPGEQANMAAIMSGLGGPPSPGGAIHGQATLGPQDVARLSQLGPGPQMPPTPPGPMQPPLGGPPGGMPATGLGGMAGMQQALNAGGPAPAPSTMTATTLNGLGGRPPAPMPGPNDPRLAQMAMGGGGMGY